MHSCSLPWKKLLIWLELGWACAHEHVPLIASACLACATQGCPMGYPVAAIVCVCVCVSLSLSLSVFPLHMQKGFIDKSITDTRPKSHFFRVFFFCFNNWQIIQRNIPQKEMKRISYICVLCYFLLPILSLLPWTRVM
jgi:hypothetical protein